jgi:hypothetical protein
LPFCRTVNSSIVQNIEGRRRINGSRLGSHADRLDHTVFGQKIRPIQPAIPQLKDVIEAVEYLLVVCDGDGGVMKKSGRPWMTRHPVRTPAAFINSVKEERSSATPPP